MIYSSVYVLCVLVAASAGQQINGDEHRSCEVITIDKDRNRDQGDPSSGAGDSRKCCGVPSNSTATCETFTLALRNLKNNTLVNVTRNVALDSFEALVNLEFVTIIGHNNPTVNCSNEGGLKLSTCLNCTIEGITWVGCGSIVTKHTSQPVIQVHNSSNITIQNCSFLRSKGQAVLLSDVSGKVSFSHCKFTDNTDYGKDGVAIHYSSSATVKSELVLIVNHCNFSRNGKRSGRSIVHIGKSTLYNSIILRDSSFDRNTGNCINVLMQNLHIDGTLELTRNKATNGGGIFATNSSITFGKMSRVTFEENKATGKNGGAIYLSDHSNLQFEQASGVTFTGNTAKNGAAVYMDAKSSMIFNEHSSVNFTKNSANTNGGAIGCKDHSNIAFKSTSTVSFIDNSASFGGALFSDVGSTVLFEGNATVSFIRNNSTEHGGALVIHDASTVSFKGNSRVTFADHEANNGGAIRANRHCSITFTENSIVTFTNNIGYTGGAIDAYNHGNLTFERNSRITFVNNMAAANGGSLYLHTKFNTIIKDNSYVEFINNTAGGSGGALYTFGNSDITITGSPNIRYTHNVAKTGGAVHATSCNIRISGTSNMTFNNNEAVHEGGAVYLNDQTNLLFDRNINMTIADNSADLGAGLYNDLSKNTTIIFNNKQLHHYNNTARVAGSLMYVHIPPSCNSSCIEERIVISNGTDLDTSNFVATPPKKIVLYEPAIPMCNDNSSGTEECNTYYVNNVMLGQEILINSCLMDYYDKPTEEAVQFIVTSGNEDYTPGSKYVLVSCSLPLKVKVTGSKASLMNYTMTLRTFALGVEDRTPININVTVMISPCHPGFQYNPQSQKCECFDHNVVFCSGSSSMIKKGYWFGEADGKATVAVCPMSYCDFSSCNEASEFCDLSPERTDQCRSHRSGTACGDCENGYTLPFYSTECINENNCTVSQTVIVIVLTVVYWIALVIAVFITMYYKISIGYLYAITYYYSMVDVLLSEYLYIPNGLYITINIMYSIVKLTPQFLGKLCLVRGLSGIDQQFIHYVHPLAVSLMLVMIVVLARFSRRLSVFISRGIIRAICFLLLLSYTSVTVTSLHLVRYLKFSGVDKIYTYLSPDIEYFQGRHLAYGIIASLCIIFIVIGVPLILIVEPFLNHKISSVKMKPLLDQFQGCYKDKYRWFAGYYMICRIVIITITIIFSSSDFTSRYLLITTCAAILLIHLSVRPYKSKLLNAFDGLLLLLLVLVSILLLAEFINSDSIVPINFALLTLPVIIFLVLCLYIHKDAINKCSINCTRHKNINKEINNITAQHSDAKDVDLTVDHSMRMNATVTVCDV